MLEYPGNVIKSILSIIRKTLLSNSFVHYSLLSLRLQLFIVDFMVGANTDRDLVRYYKVVLSEFYAKLAL